MTIQVFVTGGTFDKEYNEFDGSLYFNHSHLNEMLELGRCRQPVAVTTLMMKDSADMSPGDRKTIIESCIQCPEDQILITHGTDTMDETARALGREIRDKTVVLTGAIIPYKFGSSDGMFNLGSALAFAQCLPPGVYIAMNGKYFSWKSVRKNKLTNEFECLD